MFTQTNKSNIRTGMTLAALALTAAVCPAQTQAQNIGGFNSFFPSGPRILSPLGGGVINSANFNTGVGFNSQFANFNGQLNAFNNQRVGFAQQGADFNTQLANFNAQRTAYNNQFAQTNSAPNMPLSNFTVLNPSINPGVANGFSNGSFGFNGFNSFNALNSGVNGFGTLNSGFTNFNALNASGFGGAGVPMMAQPQQIFRARPAYNPTLPNAPASLYPSAAQIAANNSAAGSVQVNTNEWWRNLSPYPDRLHIANQANQNMQMNQSTNTNPMTWWRNLTPYPDRLYIANQSSQGQQSMNQANPWWRNLSPYPDRLYIAGQNNGFATPVRAPMRVGTGMGASTGVMVMGARGR